MGVQRVLRDLQLRISQSQKRNTEDKVHCRSVAALALVAAGVLCAGNVLAQSWGPRGLDELKQEAQRRADNRLPPVGGVKSEDMREALSNLNSLEPDAWEIGRAHV